MHLAAWGTSQSGCVDMADLPPFSLEFPMLSADGVALVLRPTVQATALEIERRFKESGPSLYRAVPSLSRVMYSGDLTLDQILDGIPDSNRNRSLRSVIRAISKFSTDRVVICHPQPLKLLPF